MIISQIEAKAVRKLRYPSRRNLILYGASGYSIEKQEEELREKEIELKKKLKKSPDRRCEKDYAWQEVYVH